MSSSVDKKPTLECIMEDVDYNYSYIESSKISLDPYYKNLNMSFMIMKLLQEIEFSINEFIMLYGKHRRFIIYEYTEEMMTDVNKYFEKIYKLLYLTYTYPQSAFRIDNKIYEIIFHNEYLEDEYGDNEKILHSIYQELLEIDTTIQTYTFEIRTYFEKGK